MHPQQLPLIALAFGLASCEAQPLSKMEREIWALDVPDHRPRPPHLPGPGEPGYPDVERPKVKGQAVLGVIPLGSSENSASRALAARGFLEFARSDTDAAGRRSISTEKKWCQLSKCCVTTVDLYFTGGKLSGARAWDYEYARLRLPVLNSSFGAADCG